MKAVYIPLGAAGHVLASLPMIGQLVQKGVDVRYFSPLRYKEQVDKQEQDTSKHPLSQEKIPSKVAMTS